jgi:hypothetical protein
MAQAQPERTTRTWPIIRLAWPDSGKYFEIAPSAPESNDDLVNDFSRVGHITGPLAIAAAENKPFP